MNQRTSGARPSDGRPSIAPPGPRSRVKPLAAALALVLAVAGAWALVPAWGGGATMPEELLGIWRTTAPAYADRALEIRPTALLFHTGERTFGPHAVRRVIRDEVGGSAAYTVEYSDGGDVEALSFRYVRAPHPAIQLRNQAFVWRREGTE